MWMPIRNPPFGSCSASIASSKSRAVSPSIVTIVRPVKSVRLRRSPSSISRTEASASAITVSGYFRGIPHLRATTSTSTPASPSKPIVSVTSASARRLSSGHAMMRASTKIPSGASRSLPSGTARRASIFRSNGTTNVPSGPRTILPTTVSRRRTRTLTTGPAGRGSKRGGRPPPFGLGAVFAASTRTRTTSPSSALPRDVTGVSGTPGTPERRNARPSPRTASVPA